MKEKWIEIGRVGVDSGQLMICDPCYIDSEWEKEDFESNTDFFFIFPDGKEEKVEHCSKRWFELIDKANSGELKLEERPNDEKRARHNFSYNAVSQATLEKRFAQLFYKLGHAGVGVVFRSGWGDGVYPVYAKVKDFGKEGLGGKRVTEIKIVMIDE